MSETDEMARLQALLEADGDEDDGNTKYAAYVTDSSSNGTFINDNKLTKKKSSVLHDGDTLRTFSPPKKYV